MKKYECTTNLRQLVGILMVGVSLVAWVGCERTPESALFDSAEPPSDSSPATAPKSPAKKVVVDPSAFLVAATNGDLDGVRKSIEAGVDVNAKDEGGRTGLLLASFDGHTPVVKLLLENGASLEHRDVEGRTALMFASTGANAEAVELLLDKGAKIDLVDSDERFTALMWAAAEGQVEVVKILLEHKANPDLRDIDGDTARDFASRNGHAEVVRLLTK